MSNNNTTHTFWKLITSCAVIIPKLQRDYAQGREKDPAIEQIRNSLIDEIYLALTSDEPLVLNFIYGEKGNDKFIPIDGQQRLTTLFLLHWYVFSRAGFNEGLGYLKNFSYDTRDTSRRFCEDICGLDLDFSSKDLASQIKECYWFTGNFDLDPTIKSMLVVIKTIHEKFFSEHDFETMKNRLIDDNCPISFLWLEMPNYQQTSDLYIKMNARGKLLSDFEIFKAKLQNSQLLDKLLPGEKTEMERILFISKYNNEFAEFFYTFFQSEYDSALMDFIKEMIRDSYLSYVSRCGVSQKAYRSEYGNIKSMNGSVFFRYIENGGARFEQCTDSEEAFINGLKRVNTLIGMFASMNEPLVFDNTLQKDYFNELRLFILNHSKENLDDDVKRYSIYSFLYKFGIPMSYEQKSAYSMWRRIIYNIVTNSVFEGRREDICEAFVFVERIVEEISSYDEASVLNALAGVSADQCTAAIRYQIKEEIEKARLIMDATWKKEILDAESYFIDGEIGFILDNSKNNDGAYDIDMFHEYYECLKRVFNGDKKLRSEISEGLFEQALLCMRDETDNKTGHLLKQPNSSTSWGFVGGNYEQLMRNSTISEKKDILRELINRIKGATNIDEELKKIISSTDTTGFDCKEKWKIPFITHNLFDVDMGDYKFKNCINLNTDNQVVLMMAGTTERSKSTELNTFLLYQELKNKGIEGKLVLFATGYIKDNEGFPRRYIEIKDALIGYEGSDTEQPYIIKQQDIIKRISWDNAISLADGK